MIASDSRFQTYGWNRSGVNADRYESGTNSGAGAIAICSAGQVTVENNVEIRRLALGDVITVPTFAEVHLAPDSQLTGILDAGGGEPFIQSCWRMPRSRTTFAPGMVDPPSLEHRSIRRGEATGWISYALPIIAVVMAGNGLLSASSAPDALAINVSEQSGSESKYGLFEGCAISVDPGRCFKIEVENGTNQFVELAILHPRRNEKTETQQEPEPEEQAE